MTRYRITLSIIFLLAVTTYASLYANDAATTDSELESALRAKVVDYMRAAASIEWVPSEDVPYWNPEHHFSFKKGETYYGLPYTQYSRNNTLETFKTQIKTVGGVSYYVGPSAFNQYWGSDCSASVANAWKQADPNFPSLLTRRLIPDRPKEVVPVGKYSLNYYDETPAIVKENGYEIMARAYALLKPGDAVVMHHNYDGHVMLVLKNDPDNSRLYIADQTGLANGVPKGREGHSTFRVDYEYSYRTLFDYSYIPIALKKIDDAAHEIQLFNGYDLDGWNVWIKGAEKPNIDPKNVFSAQNGILHISGEEYGGIQTKDSYSNYRLTVEYKWGENTYGSKIGKARDSGVLIHSFGEIGAYGGVWSKSIEANVIEGGAGDFWIVGGPDDGISATCDVVEIDEKRFFNPKIGKPITITANQDGNFQRLGKSHEWQDVTGFHAMGDYENENDWNELVIYAVGDEMRIYLNGRFVNRVYGLKRQEGKIQLQSEGAEILFRRVTLRPWDEPLD